MMKVCREWLGLSKEQQNIILKHHDSLPIKVGGIAKSFGLIVKRATLKPGISGVIKEIDGQVVVRISRHDSEERQRFTLAHEIAHFLLHREHIKEGIEDSMLFRSSLSNALEAQANRLAADIVMPLELLDKAELPIPTRFEEKVEILAGMANISIPAMEIRLGKRGF
jgi:Zn-dependent peptidase ImmA (M78 family)